MTIGYKNKYMHEHQKIYLFPFFLILLEIAVYLSNDMYLPSMPAIAKDLAISQEQVQNTLTFWFLGASSLQFILGPISDSYGRRNVILLGGVLYVLSSAACALATTLPILLTARFIQGSTICSVLVAGYATIHELFSTKQAIKILAFMGAVTILAPAFGPLIGALIVQFANWRYIFWLLFLLGFISTVLLFLYMPESNKHKHHFHYKQIIVDYRKILTNKEFVLPTIGYCLLVTIAFLWMFAAPFLMIEVYGTSSLFYGISQAFIFGCFFVGAKLTELMLEKFSLQLLIKVATIVSLLGTVLLAVVAKLYDSMTPSIVCMMIISTGTSMLFAPINRIAIEAAQQPMGRRTAVFSTMISLFGALTGWILGFIKVNSLAAIATAIVICMALATVSLLSTKVPLVSEE